MIERYAWRGGAELVFASPAGPGPLVLILAPFFEEANRTRRLLADVMRRLAARGVPGLLPDLPGTGESLARLEDVRLDDWRAAVAACAGAIDRPFLTLAVRGGALVDDAPGAIGHLRLSPANGKSLVRDLLRTRLAAERDEDGSVAMADIEARAAAGVTELAGNRLGAGLFADLRAARPPGVAPLRTLRLASDPAPADARLDAPPPWRRAEPGDDPALAGALADAAFAWMRACAG